MRSALVAAMLGLLGGEASAQSQVTGVAHYRERIAAPLGATFEAVLEDVSRADAPSTVIARDSGVGRADPPFAFALNYAPAAIDPKARYAVRARLYVGNRLMFTSDTAHPVITGGAPTEIDILDGSRGSAGRPCGATGPPRPSFSAAMPLTARRWNSCERQGRRWPDRRSTRLNAP